LIGKIGYVFAIVSIIFLAVAIPTTRLEPLVSSYLYTSLSRSTSQGQSSVLNLVPSVSSASNVWNSGDQESALHIGHVALNADLWDMSSNSVGYVSMTEKQALTTVVNFSSVSYGSEPNQVIGYPNVGYGFSAFGAASSAWDSSQLALPLKLSDLPNIITSDSYQINSADGKTPYDFAYDIWITQNIPSGSNSSSPTRGDIELMIWTDYTGNLAPHCVLSVFCTSQQQGSVDLPGTLDGSSENMSWNIWVSNGDEAEDRATTVLFILNNPQSSATISVDLAKVIGTMESTLSSGYGSYWSGTNFATYWLDYLSLGSEFRPDASNSAQYSWQLDSFCLLLNYPTLSTEGSSNSCNSSINHFTTTSSAPLDPSQLNNYYLVAGIASVAVVSIMALAFARLKHP
jgi:hypothetical protein